MNKRTKYKCAQTSHRTITTLGCRTCVPLIQTERHGGFCNNVTPVHGVHAEAPARTANWNNNLQCQYGVCWEIWIALRRSGFAESTKF